MKVKLLLARNDHTWYSKVYEIPEHFPDESSFEDHCCWWWMTTHGAEPEYLDVVTICVHDTEPFDKEN